MRSKKLQRGRRVFFPEIHPFLRAQASPQSNNFLMKFSRFTFHVLVVNIFSYFVHILIYVFGRITFLCCASGTPKRTSFLERTKVAR